MNEIIRKKVENFIELGWLYGLELVSDINTKDIFNPVKHKGILLYQKDKYLYFNLEKETKDNRFFEGRLTRIKEDKIISLTKLQVKHK